MNLTILCVVVFSEVIWLWFDYLVKFILILRCCGKIYIKNIIFVLCYVDYKKVYVKFVVICFLRV